MEGFEATAEIRKREKVTRRRTPTIALTARALKEDRERCLSPGMDAYVTKPIRPRNCLRLSRMFFSHPQTEMRQRASLRSHRPAA